MKKTWIILLIAGLFACSGPSADMAEISGIVNNPTDTEVEVLYYKDYLTNEMESVIVNLGRRNSFKASLPMSEGQFIYVRVPGRTVSLYALPGASVHVEFDAQNPEFQPVVKGRRSYESQFMVSYVQQIERNFGQGLIINRIPDMDTQTFINYMDSIQHVKIEFMATFEKKSSLDEHFVNIMTANIKYDRLAMLLRYPIYKAYFNNLEETLDVGDDYYAFLTDHDLFEDSYLRSRSYLGFLNAYIDYLMIENPYEGDEPKTYYQIQYDLVKDHLVGKSRDFALSQLLISSLNFEDFESAEAMYIDYTDLAADVGLRDIVKKEYEAILSLTPGNPAPEFTMTDINGEKVSMRDFRGQVVYLDFWASWCGPCMREMPHAQELKKKLATQHDLVFLYISIDTDEEAWRKTVADHDLQGIHLNVSGTTEGVASQYNIKGVPSFFIIGRDGNIFDNRAPRPSNPAILPSLMSALLE
jgi:thiol-disulfide isomerase/thioredoxin